MKAVVPMFMAVRRFRCVWLLALLGFAACDSGVVDSGSPVASIEISPSEAAPEVGASVQLQAIVKDAADNPLSGRPVFWATEDGAIAEVSSTGLVTGRAPGTVQIAASSEGEDAVARITVLRKAVAAVSVSPSEATIPSGATQQFEATTRDADGDVLAGREVHWSSSDPDIASIDGSGVATARRPGTTTIRATSEGTTGEAELTVRAGRIASVVIRPDSIRFTALGETARLSATARDEFGEEMSDAEFDWTSLESGVASIDGTGLVEARANGIAAVIVSSGGEADTAIVRVRQVVEAVEVTPSERTLQVGTSVQLEGKALDARGVAVEDASFTWRSSNTAVARVDDEGKVTAIAPGSATITASSGGENGTSSISVTVGAPNRLHYISGDDQKGTVGRPLPDRLVVRVTDSEGNPVSGVRVEWNAASGDGSLGPSAVNTDADGRAEAEWTLGLQPGKQTATATVDGLDPVIFDATGRPGAASSISIEPASVTLSSLGDTRQFTATAQDSFGNTLTGLTFRWSSSESSVAEVTTSGVATALDNGTTTVAAEADGIEGTATLTVAQKVDRVQLEPSSLTLQRNETEQLHAEAVDANDRPVASARFSWRSDDDDVAEVDDSGRVTGVDAGEAVVTVTSDGKSATASIEVERGRPARLEILGEDDREGTVGDELEEELVVRVLDTNGDPVEDVEVVWDGDGTFEPTTSLTDDDGEVETEWTLGTRAGRQTARATVAGLPPVEFSATARPAAASRLIAVSPTGVEQGTVGEVLTDSLVVRAEDEYDNPVPDVEISWNSAEPETEFGSGNSKTDADGTASTRWTLTTKAGTTTATARADDVDSVVFSAEAEPGPPNSIDRIGWDSQGEIACYGEPLDKRPEVEIRDTYENPAVGTIVEWKPVAEFGPDKVDPEESAVDGNGRAGTSWTLLSPGLHKLTAYAGDLSITFEATALYECNDDDDD